jgi:heavy metal efflux system protein
LEPQKALERLSEVTLPDNLQPQIGTDWSPVGQIYWYTLQSTNPEYDLMELKALEDWVLEKQFKSVPNVVDVASFGGITKEYQVAIDPNKLVEYGLSIGAGGAAANQQQRQCRRQFHRAGLQQVNVRSSRALRQRPGHRKDRPQDSKRHAHSH